MVGANRYRNPDQDLPADFDENREGRYEALDLPLPETGKPKASKKLQQILMWPINCRTLEQKQGRQSEEAQETDHIGNGSQNDRAGQRRVDAVAVQKQRDYHA